ncbi:MAG TPA: hypothetical protein VKU40_02995 [Thermoanaerobaculia bacterium]|nr:hypothetical protein [Thermoanaerobaculia bacterium]
MLTSELVNRSIHAVQLTLDDEVPPLSRLTMKRDQRALVSVLKHLTYILLINSNRMRLVAHRGREIVSRIFDALISEDGHLLLPRDLQRRWEEADDTQRRRVVCDFIAGMTDRYAIEFYARLHSETFYSMFKPF